MAESIATNKLENTNVMVSNSIPLPLVYVVLALCASVYLNVIGIRTIGWLIAVFVVVISMIVYYQESILYMPVIQGWRTPTDNPSGYQTPSQQRLKYEDVYFQTSDGLKLHGWFIPAPVSSTQTAKPPTLLFCHENAGNIGLRIPEFQKIHSLLKVNQFVFDYRGYGFSEDAAPSENGLVNDALAAFQWLLDNRPDIDHSKIVMTGRSLGGAVAIAATLKLNTAAVQPKALIVENSFTSISDMVDAKFPLLNIPFFKQFFLRMHWDSHKIIGELDLPILFMSSINDEIVPHEQMLALHSASKAPVKVLHKFQATHNDIWAAGGVNYWSAKKDFITTHCG